MATTYLSHTMSTPTARTKSTISAWVKKTSEGANSTIFGGGDAATDCAFLNFNASDKLFLQSATSDSADWGITTDAVFRDPSAWYHVVAKIDTTQSTSTDRVKIYVNGNLQTVTGSYPSQNYDMQWSRDGEVQLVGKYPSTGIYFNGSMAHVHFTDGYAYDASTFGETDSTTGIWVSKTNPSVTYGTNGFFLKFENSGAMGTDSSGQSNTFSVSGTLTQNVDTPTNNFATLNPLDKSSDVNTTINGNTSATWNGVNGHTIRSTLAVSSGKYYWELNNANNLTVGIVSTEEPIIPTSGNLFPGGSGFGASSYSYKLSDGNKGNNNTFSSYGSAITTSDILGCALDLDNGKIFWSKNGVWQDSGDPANGTNPAFTSISSDKTWSPAYGYVGSGANTLNVNYGSGYFGTTAVSSAGSNASGIGIFEYDVPAGYTALSTKGLDT